MLIGAHESIAGGVSLAFARAAEHGAKSVQIFTKNARGWKAPPLSEGEVEAFRRQARASGLPCIAHASYLINLGSDQPEVRRRSIECLHEELTRAERLGVSDLVLHPGVHPDLHQGISLIAEALNEVQAATPGFQSRLCLEVTAGQGNSIGWRFEHLADILAKVSQVERVGLCLDTCHLFAAGYDLSTPKGYDETLAQADRLLGLARVRCLHLNDCKGALGCRVDRHEEIGKGTLGLEVFRSLVNEACFAKTVAVLETPSPERYGGSIGLLESLVRRG